MKRKPLRVSLHAHEPSIVELTVGDRVQLDRVIPASRPSPSGYLAERHGRLLGPGATTVALPPGHYFFKTLSDANLRVVTGGVSASVTAHDKGDWPDPSSISGTPPPAPDAKGDEPAGELPTFTID